jgi:hypothetical protein
MFKTTLPSIVLPFLFALAPATTALAQATPPATPPATPIAEPRQEPTGTAGTPAGQPEKPMPKADARDATKSATAKVTEPALGTVELRKKSFHLDGDGLALQGYDPLSYFLAKGPTLGKKQFEHTERGVTYHFVSKENRDAFAAEPQKWEPPYGGWCAYAVIDGEKVDIDPLNFEVIDGKVYLFYKGFWGDARDKWQARIKTKNATKVVAEADAGWKKLEAADQAIVDDEQKAKAKKAAKK